jgi:hypothetical protein
MTLRTITPDKIEKVKELLTRNGIRAAARYGGVSFYTAWCIKNGKYDQPSLQTYNAKRCPITGYRM